ncbi:MAG: hypothetical protein ACI4YA_01705 [Candidatus Spyradenecus sp.]
MQTRRAAAVSRERVLRLLRLGAAVGKRCAWPPSCGGLFELSLASEGFWIRPEVNH